MCKSIKKGGSKPQLSKAVLCVRSIGLKGRSGFGLTRFKSLSRNDQFRSPGHRYGLPLP